ncbi:putative protein kinase [Trypanosoma rangeli]|uniref:Protein kinase domain-containing protein n=1 Tax=Trypanosoma rangeli TaxID=5698 RepID=A0A3R7K7C3_TRYRA|nr:putative protein kinase [Trypanosoma rangeli]RNE95299.1 putative protein kinase [Trypanosoma rangeli]|eukprot:RNE95299.1 putative protein kinase [Trypanosoma rangeli]
MHGRYVPQEVLGTGTYGRVLRCSDTHTGKHVAVKVAQSDAAYRRSALNEIRVLQLLSHSEDTLKMFDYFEDGGHLCIVCELLHTDLYELLRKNGFRPLLLDTVRTIGERVLRALAELHKVGYMHCDIKPANVMLGFNNADGSNRSDFPKTCLIDFGAVRQFHENTYYDVQSLWYRAPEVILGLPYTFHIDSWSVGCLLFELYTGKPLFSGENPREQMINIMCTLGMPSMEALSAGTNVEKLQLPCVGMDVHAETSLRHLIMNYRRNISGFQQLQQSAGEEAVFVNLLCSLLQPDVRWRTSCVDALHHAFFNPCSLNRGGVAGINFSFFGCCNKGLQSSGDSNFGGGLSSTGSDVYGFSYHDHHISQPTQTQPHSDSTPILSASCNSISFVGLVGNPPGMVLPASLPPPSPQRSLSSSHVVLQNVMYHPPPVTFMQTVSFHSQQLQQVMQRQKQNSGNILPMVGSPPGHPQLLSAPVRPNYKCQKWDAMTAQLQQQIPPAAMPMLQCNNFF